MFCFDLGVMFFVLLLFIVYVVKDSVLLQMIISVLSLSLIVFMFMVYMSSFLVSVFVLLIYASGLLLLLMYVSSMLSTSEVYKGYIMNIGVVISMYCIFNTEMMFFFVDKSLNLFSLYSEQYFFMLLGSSLLCSTLYLALILLI